MEPERTLAPATIVCPDCGGTAHLVPSEPEGGWEPGDIAAYRCSECLDRWDVQLGDD